MADEEQIILPERFKRLEYLESSGTQYIDTNYIVTPNTGLFVDAINLVAGDQYSMGCANMSVWRVPANNNNSSGFLWNNVWQSAGTTFGGLGRYKGYVNFLNSLKGELYISDVLKSTLTLTKISSFSSNQPVFLFGASNSSLAHSWKLSGRIYEAKISEGTSIVRHFVPAYDTYSARGCMYEVIEGKAYYNKGTGDFIYYLGLENEQIGVLHKLPEGFKHVKYLIANGSQYIDTNYVPTNETGYYLEGQGYVSESTVRYYFGSNETTDWNANQRIYFGATPNNVLGWMTSITVTNAAANLRQETKVALNFLNSRKCITTINDADIINELGDLTFTPSQKIFLFNLNLGGNVHTGGLKGRIDTFLISEGDQIVRQFVPCLDEDGIPCMYELYTGTVHYNQGLGQFSYPREYTNDPINLPAGYTKCVYLQSDRTQWIDTEVIPDADTGVYLKAQHLSYENFTPFGSWENYSSYYYPLRFNTNSKASVYSFGTTYQSGFQYDKGDDLVFTSTMNLYNDRTVNFWSEDTNWHGIIPVNFTATFTRPLWLFSYNMDNATINATYGKFAGRIFRAKITKGDYLIHDFVPCLDTDNRPCMYDLVTQEPYYNQSGGTEFAYCVEHQLPSNFVKLDYIESTGTQIIKTGIIPTDTTGIYVDAYHTKYNGNINGSVIGLRNTNGNTYFYVGRVQRDTNVAGFGWGAFTTPGGYGNVRYEASLNFLNDRQSIITAPAFAQRINTLGTLAFTPTKDLYMFGMNSYDGAATLYSTYRIYRAKISEGTEIVRDFVPAWDVSKQKPCMYDLINNVAYYNDGEGEFIYNKDFEGTYKGYTGLGCIGNKLGSDYDPINEKLPSGYTRVEFLESILVNTANKHGGQWINTDLYVKDLSFRIEYAGITGGGGNGTMVFGIEPGASGNFYGVLTQANNYGVGCQTRCLKTSEGTHQMVNVYDVPPGTRVISEVNLQDLYCYIKVEGKGTQKKSIINLTHDFADYAHPCGLFSRAGGGIRTVSRVYSFSANYNGVPAANYIPAIDTAGIPCMYDTVTDKSLYNQGSGQFIVGLKTISHALQLYLPETGGTILLSLPTNDKTEIYEQKIRANNPNWEITFYYH